MKTPAMLSLSAVLLAATAAMAAAQDSSQPRQTHAVAATAAVSASAQTSAAAAPATDSSGTPATTAVVNLYRPMDISHIRPADKRGLNVFDPPKDDSVTFTGFALSFGGAFTQEF